MKEGDNKGIILNKDIDLYKIPINVLKDSKLSNFKGNLIKEILEQMIKSEDKNQVVAKDINKNNQKKIKNSNYKISNPMKSPDKNIYKAKNVQKTYNSFNNNNNLNNLKMSNSKLNRSAYLKVKPSSRSKYISVREFKIEKINFQMKYNTQMGEDLAVIGSINELGCWDQGRSLKMGWNDGNIWRASLYFGNKNINDFEYKFIFISRGCVRQWEDGSNRKFILSQIKGLIESCPGGGTLIHLKNISNQNIDFNYNDYTLTIICEWNKK
jgi:hypothetical protein